MGEKLGGVLSWQEGDGTGAAAPPLYVKCLFKNSRSIVLWKILFMNLRKAIDKVMASYIHRITYIGLQTTGFLDHASMYGDILELFTWQK